MNTIVLDENNTLEIGRLKPDYTICRPKYLAYYCELGNKFEIGSLSESYLNFQAIFNPAYG